MFRVLGVVLALVVAVALVVKRVNYGLALIIGALILGVASGLSPHQLLGVLSVTLKDRVTIDLVLITSLIPILASCMKETGMIDGLIKGVKRALMGRGVLAMMPALMGALPMPGGALLSAPLIDEESETLGLSREERSFVNVWFRHWNFFIYPLSSPLILLAGLTGFSLYTLILMNILPVVLYLTLGYLVSIRRIEEKDSPEKHGDPKALTHILLGVSPILLTVVLNLAGVHMAAALLMGIASTFLIGKVAPRKALKLLVRGFDWRIPFAIIGVMYFRGMIEHTDVFSEVYPYLSAVGLPILLLLLVMDWVIGFATAMPSAGIAMVFPIALVSLGSLNLAVVGILYSTLIFAYLISPMHLCLILTVEYYKAHLHSVYKKLIPTALASYLIFLGFFTLMGGLLP